MSQINEASPTWNLWPDEIKILVIDDEQDILNLIRLSLEPAGFRILRTTRPEEGLDLARREKPDLLILDIMMPGLDGLELLRRVRRHPALAKIPVIVVSARVSNADQLRMLQIAGDIDREIDAYVGKPFDPGFLLKTVKTVLLNHRDFLLAKKQGQNHGVVSAPLIH
ncbi:MAG TPA: response regulator [Anaerolineae bacterium]|nr:response regulator [Anaerolineae bacterium]